jgi:hypothetical protein
MVLGSAKVVKSGNGNRESTIVNREFSRVENRQSRIGSESWGLSFHELSSVDHRESGVFVRETTIERKKC